MSTPYQLELISHEIENTRISQRSTDGFVNATAMCKAAGKLFADYRRLATTDAFLKELSTDMGIPISGLIVTVKGGISEGQGTWVHPDVAIHLGQWCSPKFAVAVARWVREWMEGRAAGQNLPYHLRRYVANVHSVPAGHFSILNELMVYLIGPMEAAGYTLPEKLVPDISHGRMFCKWLREEKGVDTDSLPTYSHRYEDGRVVDAKAYPERLLPDFRKHLREEWIPKRSQKYFEERDANALHYLQCLPIANQLSSSPEDKLPPPVPRSDGVKKIEEIKRRLGGRRGNPA